MGYSAVGIRIFRAKRRTRQYLPEEAWKRSRHVRKEHGKGI